MIRAIRILLYLVAALVVVLGLLLAFLATPPGRAVVASLAERAVAGSGLTLSIGRLTGWPPFSFMASINIRNASIIVASVLSACSGLNPR